MRILALLAASLALLTGAHAADAAYKWTDAQGVVHYGDSVPSDMASRAEPVDANRDQLTDAQKQAAAAKLARDRAILARQVALTPRAANTTPARAASAATPCEQAWRDYEKSLACFAPYRYGRDQIRAASAQHCTEVEQPAEPCH